LVRDVRLNLGNVDVDVARPESELSGFGFSMSRGTTRVWPPPAGQMDDMSVLPLGLLRHGGHIVAKAAAPFTLEYEVAVADPQWDAQMWAREGSLVFPVSQGQDGLKIAFISKCGMIGWRCA
jgi:hypothetical protein